MRRARLIPVLTIDGQKLIKTIKFSKPNYLGDPLNVIKIFNDKEVDEIIVLDITASKEEREPNYKLIKEMASECFMPLGYGGGIKTLEQANRIFSLGIEKAIVNSATYDNLSLINKISSYYGSSSTIVAIDVKKNFFGKEKISFKGGRIIKNITPEEWAKKCEEAGAGEIILTDISRDGTFSGLNLLLTKRISGKVSIPVVACGGLNTIGNFLDGINAGAAAIAAGSFFVYKNNDLNSILVNYPTQQELMEKVFNYL